MGVVIRQSFWTSIIIYVGVVIGYVNSLILFPAYLTTDQIGLVRQLQAAALLLVPFASLGVGPATVKFYPEYSKSKENRMEFFTIMIGAAVAGYIICTSILILFKEGVVSYFSERSEAVNEYLYIIFILLFILTLSSAFEAYLRARLNIVFANFANGVLIRLLVGSSILLYGFDLISFNDLVISLVLIYGVAMLSVVGYAYSVESFRLNFKFINTTKERFSRLFNFSSFAILGGAGNVILLNIDILMVTGLAGLDQTGIYTTAFYIAIVIEMPRRAIAQISSPILSQAFNDNDLDTVKSYYNRVSINQTIIGGLLFLGILGNLDNIYMLIPNRESFIAGMPVVMIIGLAKLLDMIFGQNNEILAYSKFYRMNVLLVIVLGVLTIGFNYLLIPQYGITGAAVASFSALLVFNALKYIFIWIRFGFQPFDRHTALLVVLIALVYWVSSLIPFMQNVFIDIIARSIIITVAFCAPIYFLRISKEINQTIHSVFKRLKP